MHALYNPVRYQPRLGGHAPGHLRDAFEAAVEAYESWNDGEPEPIVKVGYDETPMTISKICGLVWNCSDIMPWMLCRDIDDLLPSGHECGARSTYAQGARHMKAMIDRAQQ